ncbi:lytic murein transglycosylase B [Aliikangiella maris]
MQKTAAPPYNVIALMIKMQQFFKQYFFTWLTGYSSLIFLLFSSAAGAQKLPPEKLQVAQQIEEFAQMMADEHKFNAQEIKNKLHQAKFRQDIIDKITRPAEAMPWHQYRKIWMKPKRIQGGVEFWLQHRETLQKAQEKYGVPPEIIVSIIGVETFFGRIQGSYPVIDALYTLGFHYPKRASFFRRELAQYWLLAREQDWPLDSVKGSYAGAMGMGQFISSSYRAYGVDFNQDGQVNLFDDPVDMIGSVANYFHQHRWQANGFVARNVDLPKNLTALVQTDLELKLIASEVAQDETLSMLAENNTNKLGVFAFELPDNQRQHWLVGDNFYVITRYNRSTLYALAVFQLSEQIRSAYAAQLK